MVDTLAVRSKATFTVPLEAVRSRLGQYTNGVGECGACPTLLGSNCLDPVAYCSQWAG